MDTLARLLFKRNSDILYSVGQARRLIMQGIVFVNGVKETNPGKMVSESDDIQIRPLM